MAIYHCKECNTYRNDDETTAHEAIHGRPGARLVCESCVEEAEAEGLAVCSCCGQLAAPELETPEHPSWQDRVGW